LNFAARDWITGGFEAASFNQTPPFENADLFGNRTEDLPMARPYREAPLNAIWEGSSNVVALDVLRVLRRNREAAHAAVDLAGVCGAPGKAAALGIKKFLL
jgi:hypothetical protein